MNKKYPTKITPDYEKYSHGPFHWTLSNDPVCKHFECCMHNEYKSLGSGSFSSFNPPQPVVKGNGGWAECLPCAIKSGHGQPPSIELLSIGMSKPKVDSIKAKKPPYNQSYWKIAAKDLKCVYGNGCAGIVKAGTIYLDRLNKGEVECVGCAKKGAAGFGPTLEVPTLSDFGVEDMPEVQSVPIGSPTAKGWIWVKVKNYTKSSASGSVNYLLNCKCMDFHVPGIGGCKEKLVEGTWAAQKTWGDSSILCESCAIAAGHGSPGDTTAKATKQKRQKKAPMICIKCGVRLCEACGECETKGCRLVGRAVCTPEQLAEVKHLLAETQKVRGYVALAETLKVPRPYQIVTEQADIAALKLNSSKVFVRPCPVRPRHGFVESRLVDAAVVDNIPDVVDAIFAEARSADPQAELLIVPYVDSAHNMVITPTRLAIGAGNDGATAGKGSITVPLMGEKFSEIPQKLYDQAGVDINTEDPYFEAVADKDHRVSFTQLRAGVKIPPAVGDDYIPKDMVVEEVIEASGDLLEWESQVKRIKDGTVVCHVGGTLTSHYGVHCLYNNIPVLTSHRPSVGDFLQAKEKGAAPDPESIKRGLSVGISIPLKQDPRYVNVGEISAKDAIKVLLVALHNAGAMGEKDGFWIGFSAAIMQRVGMAASHGEARHKNIPKSGKVNRPAVYKVALADFFASRETLGAAQWSFQNLSWGSGYGGPKWAKCTEATIELDSSIRDFLNDPSDYQVGRLITKLNNAVNQAHNGGWWLNKFVDATMFDQAAAQSINLIAQAGIGMFRVANTKFTDLTGSIERWRVAPPITVAKGEILAYTKKDCAPTNGIPTCMDCGKQYPQLIKYAAAVAEGLSCNDCGGNVRFKFNGEWVEVEPEEVDDSDGSKCADTSCAMCYPSHSEDEDEDSDPPEPPEINEHTNVGNFVQMKADHVITAAQGKYLKGGYLHLQLKTDASVGYYSYDLIFKSLNPQLMAPYAHEWSWSGSESHEYVPLTVMGVAKEKVTNGVSLSTWSFFNHDAGISFWFDPLSGYFKDNINEQTPKEISTEGQATEAEETPF